LGVAAEVELRDYFRQPVAAARQAIAELEDAGVLIPVQVDWLEAEGVDAQGCGIAAA
jgi:uncharacterized protein YcaQ